MSPHLGLQRILVPGSQASALTTGEITLAGARKGEALIVDYIVVAGGGGGGYDQSYSGGGGAGGYRSATSQPVFVGDSYTIIVGAGGAPNKKGSNSSFNGMISSFALTQHCRDE